MEPTRTLARQLWNAVEPIHAAVYFDPQPTEELKAAGIRGGRMAYFAGRFAPLGAVGPGPVAAVAYGFALRMISRAVPDAWRFTAPERCVEVWSTAAGAALRRDLPEVDVAHVAELASLLADGVSACRYEGRALAAGWLDVPVASDPFVALWLRATVLREHRGDGHVLAAVHAGLRGLETTVTHAATGAVSRELMQRNRGWTDEEWDEATAGLIAQGLLDASGQLTDTGQQLRREIEEATDRLAQDPVARLGEAGVERAIELAVPLSRQLIDSGVVPIPYGVGVPRP